MQRESTGSYAFRQHMLPIIPSEIRARNGSRNSKFFPWPGYQGDQRGDPGSPFAPGAKRAQTLPGRNWTHAIDLGRAQTLRAYGNPLRRKRMSAQPASLGATIRTNHVHCETSEGGKMQAELEVIGNESENYVISIRMKSICKPAHTPCVLDIRNIHQELFLSRMLM